MKVLNYLFVLLEHRFFRQPWSWSWSHCLGQSRSLRLLSSQVPDPPWILLFFIGFNLAFLVFLRCLNLLIE